MTVQEFSNTFDTLLNSHTHMALFGDGSSRQDIVLDEYEKSCFLTLAQEQLVLSYYNGKNSALDSFEKTEEIRRYLSSLVKTQIIPIVRGYYNNGQFHYDSPTGETITGNTQNIYIDLTDGGSYSYIETEGGTHTYTRIDNGYISSNSIDILLPNTLWFITYESAKLTSTDTCIEGREVEVIPTTLDDYFKTNENPFKGPNTRRALRLDVENNIVELVSKYNIGQYFVRYLEKLSPIVLTDLSDSDLETSDLEINGIHSAQTCALHEALHRPILELAVMLALRSRGINIDNNS